MKDGSRHFANLPAAAFFDQMRAHLPKLDGAVETGFVSDGVTEMWLDFKFRDHQFSINNQMGEYWVFVRRPDCPDTLLAAVVEHFAVINPA